MNLLETVEYPTKILVNWFGKDYVKGWLPWLIVSFIFMAFEGGALGALSYMVRPMFDEIFVAGDRTAVFWVSVTVFLIFVGKALAGVAQSVITAKVTRNVSAEVQNDVVRHLVTIESSFYQDNPPGVLMDRVRGDPNAAANMIAGLFSRLAEML